MSTIFFNKEIISKNKTFVDSFCDFCFRSIRYLFKGREIHIINGQVVHNKMSYPSRTFLGIAIAVASIGFSTLLGTLPKIFILLLPSIRKDHKIAHLHITLNQSHQKLEQIAYNIEQALSNNSKIIWKSPKFINKVDQFMHLAKKRQNFFFKALQLEGNNDPKKIAHILEDQTGVKRCYGTKNGDDFFYFSDGGYCYKFFNLNLTSIYHLVRHRANTDQFVNSFFEEKSEQSKLRKSYNKLCDRIQPLQKNLTDDRFSKWTKNDLNRENELESTTKPTFYGFTYLFNGSLHHIPYLIFGNIPVTDKLRRQFKDDL